MRILSIAGDPEEAAARNRQLDRLGHVVDGVYKRESLARSLAADKFDAIVIWSDLPAGYRAVLKKEIHERCPDIPVIDGCKSVLDSFRPGACSQSQTQPAVHEIPEAA